MPILVCLHPAEQFLSRTHHQMELQHFNKKTSIITFSAGSNSSRAAQPKPNNILFMRLASHSPIDLMMHPAIVPIVNFCGVARPDHSNYKNIVHQNDAVQVRVLKVKKTSHKIQQINQKNHRSRFISTKKLKSTVKNRVKTPLKWR